MKGNWIVKNLILAVAFVLLLGILASWGLNVITRHGKTVTAPDFSGMTVSEAIAAAKEADVSVKVTDSVFVRRLQGGVVYRQLPAPGSTVKKGRSIFLTINSVVPRKVVMPNLFGYSVAEARSELHNRSLNLGRLTYVSDIANNVLEQKIGGKTVKAGDLVVSGSVVDITVGIGSGNGTTTVPRVTGMKYVNAVDAIHDRFLNVGNVSFDKDIKTYADSMNAVVYKQDAVGSVKSLGAVVNLSLTLDQSKLQAQ